MKILWLLLLSLLSCTQAPRSAPADASSYVQATSTTPHSFTVVVRAPANHPLFLENCNGAINWGLTNSPAPTEQFDWLVMRNACLSSPIKIEPGTSRSFVLATPISGESAPTPGQYHLVLLGVFSSWARDRPLDQPQVSQALLISNPVSVGP